MPRATEAAAAAQAVSEMSRAMVAAYEKILAAYVKVARDFNRAAKGKL